MNCREYHDWLQCRLDGAALDGAAAERHVAECLVCRELHHAAQRLTDGLRLLPRLAPPADLAARITRRVQFEQQRSRRLRLYTVSALAASLLLAVGVWRSLRPTTPAVAREPVVARSETPPPSLHRQMDEMGQAMASLTKRTTDETMYQTRLLLPELSLSPPVMVRADVPGVVDAERSLSEVRRGMSAGVEPVTNSAKRAVRLFFRELP